MSTVYVLIVAVNSDRFQWCVTKLFVGSRLPCPPWSCNWLQNQPAPSRSTTPATGWVAHSCSDACSCMHLVIINGLTTCYDTEIQCGRTLLSEGAVLHSEWMFFHFFTLHRMDIYGADQAISVNIGTEEELRKQNQVLAARLVYQLDLLSSPVYTRPLTRIWIWIRVRVNVLIWIAIRINVTWVSTCKRG